jgi:hypothetical protein
MFYRLRDAAKRRPTRALMIAAAVMLAGTIVHLFALFWAFVKWNEDPLLTPAESASRLATSYFYARLGIMMDWIGVGTTLALLAWAGWRMYRRLP